MPRVIHFEIHADDPQRAMRFYENLFGWQFEQWEGLQEYWFIVTGPKNRPGINGGLTRRRGPAENDAVTAYVCTIDVPSIDEAMDRVKSLGGRVIVPATPLPGTGWLAYCKDSEGNVFRMMQGDPSAKASNLAR